MGAPSGPRCIYAEQLRWSDIDAWDVLTQGYEVLVPRIVLEEVQFSAQLSLTVRLANAGWLASSPRVHRVGLIPPARPGGLTLHEQEVRQCRRSWLATLHRDQRGGSLRARPR